MDHATLPIIIFILLFSGFIITMIMLTKRGKEVFLRPINGLKVIDDAIGRAAEEDRPIMFNLGFDDLSVNLFCSLAVMGYVVRKAAKLSMPVYVPLAQPLAYAMAEEFWKDGYAAMGKEGMFAVEDCLRYMSSNQSALGAGIAGWIKRDHVGANFMFGTYGFESMMLAEAGQQAGAFQIACTPSFYQVPFFMVSCDYTVFGEEFYAAGAYFNRDPVLTGSLVGQDYSKLVLLLLIVLGSLLLTIFQKTDYLRLLLQW